MGVNPTPLQMCNYFECNCPIRTRPQMVNSIPLSKSLFHFQHLYCIVKISIPLSQSLFHCQNLYFIVKSLSHCHNLYFNVTMHSIVTHSIPLSHTLFHSRTLDSLVTNPFTPTPTLSLHPLSPPSRQSSVCLCLLIQFLARTAKQFSSCRGARGDQAPKKSCLRSSSWN